MGADISAARMTVDQFLDWAEGRDGKHELDNGLVIAMAPEQLIHGRTKAAIHASLAAAIQTAGLACEAIIDSIALRIADATSFIPDVLVHCGERLGGTTRETRDAVVVVEVLSPSTAYRDVSAKLGGYFSLPAVQHYLIVDPERRLLVHHRRGDGDAITTRILAAGVLTLEPPGLTMSVESLFGPPEP